MLQHGAVALAVVYIVVSAAAGFLGVALGTAIVRRGKLTW
jgi:fluoride ion exporter CrcB/FEX